MVEWKKLGEVANLVRGKVISKDFIRDNLICKYKQYLADTDYVISKLNEAKIEDDDLFNSLKEKYAEVLTKRKEARAKINELEAR